MHTVERVLWFQRSYQHTLKPNIYIDVFFSFMNKEAINVIIASSQISRVLYLQVLEYSVYKVDRLQVLYL